MWTQVIFHQITITRVVSGSVRALCMIILGTGFRVLNPVSSLTPSTIKKMITKFGLEIMWSMENGKNMAST